ncbi:MAG: mechanosensitive ion channel [Euryarchaeota archaeon]|nr:mechanosensitive ion channel [Euryarchaeota archaeon]
MRISLVFAVLLISFVPMLISPGVYGQVYPESFEKSINGGTSYEFHFAVFNDKNCTLFYSIILPDEGEWGMTANPVSGILNPGDARDITLKLDAPKASLHENWVFDIKVEFYNTTGLVEVNYVTLHIHLNARAFELLYFTIPFPESWGYWGNFLNIVIFWAVVGLVIYLVFSALKRLVQMTKTKVDDILLQILHTPVTIWVISYGIFNSSLVFPLSNRVFSYIYLVYNIVTIIIITWIIYRIYRRLIIHYAFIYRGKLGRMEGAIISALDKLGVFTILSIGGIMLLQAVGIDVTVLLASMGILGIILGFAAQDTIGNFFSGIHILLDRSIEVGDYILLENDENVYLVKDVGLRSTKLYDLFANTLIFLPNNIIANHKIINLSRPNSKLKLRVDVGVSYGADIEKVKKALLEVALENEHVMKDDKYKPAVIFHSFGESSLNFRLYLWIDDLKDQWEVQSEIRSQIVNKFRELGIEIPFPQVDVHIKR